ncbi:uncharacterized protein LOC144148282 [Haemaphysalis longicornis]
MLSEEDYEGEVLPPARATGSVRSSFFAEELRNRRQENVQQVDSPAGGLEEGGASQSLVTGALALLLLLPALLALTVYLGAKNPFAQARAGRLQEGILGLDDDVAPHVDDPAHQGHHIKTLNGDFEQELSWADNTLKPVLLPARSLPTNEPPPYAQARNRKPPDYISWPRRGHADVGGRFPNATSGPRPMEDEDIPMGRGMPYKRMGPDDRTTRPFTTGAAVTKRPDGAVVPLEKLPELLVFTRLVDDAKSPSESPNELIPTWREPRERK